MVNYSIFVYNNNTYQWKIFLPCEECCFCDLEFECDKPDTLPNCEFGGFVKID